MFLIIIQEENQELGFITLKREKFIEEPNFY